MLSTTRRYRLQASAALGLLLAAAPGFAANEGDWGFRNAFRAYVYGGTGVPPLSASNGASCAANPDLVKGGCNPKIGQTAGVFGWTATSWSYALPSGAGTIEMQGTVLFNRPDHLFNMAIKDPILAVAANGSATLSVHVTLNSTLPTVPSIDQRLSFGTFALTGPVVVTPTTVTWSLGSGAITAEAADAMGGEFLLAGAALDPIQVILPFEEPPSGTPVASTVILLKDNPEKPDARGLTLTVSKEPAVVATGIDPTADGASLRVVSSTFDQTYQLPASNWTAVLKKGVVAGYKYADPKRLLGPISAAQISAGVIKAKGKGGALGHTLGTEPQNTVIVVSSGDDAFCAGVGAASKKTFKAGKLYKGSKNPAPASCPAS